MKFLTVLLLLTAICGKGNAQQCRYLDPVFPQTFKTSNIVYATAPQITAVYISENTTTSTDLKIDMYRPLNDTAVRRPAIIFAHPGGFFLGAKEANDMQALADSFAHRGYVTCSMDYRIYFNLLSASSGERAVYRAVQDVDALIRYLMEYSDTYGIDTNQIFFWGSSAGSFAGLHHLYMDEAERPASSFQNPDLGCKSCSGNSYVHNTRIKAMVSCWGAVGDTSWIQQSADAGKALLMFHGDADPIVPFSYGYPFTAGATLPQVYGSASIAQRLQNTGIYYEFYPAAGQAHEYYGAVNGNFITPPNSYYPFILNKAASFLYHRLENQPCNSSVQPLDTYSDIPAVSYVNNMLHIIWEKPFDGNLNITDITGKSILSTVSHGNEFLLNKHLIPGVYILTFHSAKKSGVVRFVSGF